MYQRIRDGSLNGVLQNHRTQKISIQQRKNLAEGGMLSEPRAAGRETRRDAKTGTGTPTRAYRIRCMESALKVWEDADCGLPSSAKLGEKGRRERLANRGG